MTKIAALLMMLFVPVCIAQDGVQDEAAATDTNLRAQRKTGDQKMIAGGQSFSNDISRATENHFGFLFSAYQGYTTDRLVKGSDTGTGVSAIVPRAYLNLGKRRSTFHLDGAAGYRLYSESSDRNSWDYYGNLQYLHQFSRKTEFNVWDQFTSSFNDSWSFVSLNSPISYSPTFANEVMFNLQRINRNALWAELTTQLGRKAQLGFFGRYSTYLYPDSNLEDTHGFQAGASFSYRITRWLNLENEYSTYLNHVDTQFQDEQIHRLRMAGLGFNLSRAWRVWAGGGAEYSKDQGTNRLAEGVTAGTEIAADRAYLSLAYQRGFTSGIGISRLLMSDVYSGNAGYRITPWMNVNLESYYYRSREFDATGLLETLSTGGSLQFAIRPSLIVSANGYYQRQKARNFSVQGLDLDRYTVYAGLQYAWPSPRRINSSRTRPGGQNPIR